MKEHSREGERRREMGGALPPATPPQGLLRPPLDPPLHFKRITHASPSIAVEGGIAHKRFALQYGFETRARRVNRGNRCLPTRVGIPQVPPNSAGVGIPQAAGQRSRPAVLASTALMHRFRIAGSSR